MIYRWIGDLVCVRLPDASYLEGILLEVSEEWLVVQEEGVPRAVPRVAGVVLTRAWDMENPYAAGYARAWKMLKGENSE